MAATGIGNPLGAVVAADWGTPKIFTGIAIEVISGGVLVFASGVTANVISSGLNSYIASDVEVAKDASGLKYNGIAMQDTGSGIACPIATDGVFILMTNGSVTASQPVVCDGSNAVANLGGSPAVISQVGHQIGRAWTTATSGGYALIQLG